MTTHKWTDISLSITISASGPLYKLFPLPEMLFFAKFHLVNSHLLFTAQLKSRLLQTGSGPLVLSYYSIACAALKVLPAFATDWLCRWLLKLLLSLNHEFQEDTASATLLTIVFPALTTRLVQSEHPLNVLQGCGNLCCASWHPNSDTMTRIFGYYSLILPRQ